MLNLLKDKAQNLNNQAVAGLILIIVFFSSLGFDLRTPALISLILAALIALLVLRNKDSGPTVSWLENNSLIIAALVLSFVPAIGQVKNFPTTTGLIVAAIITGSWLEIKYRNRAAGEILPNQIEISKIERSLTLMTLVVAVISFMIWTYIIDNTELGWYSLLGIMLIARPTAISPTLKLLAQKAKAEASNNDLTLNDLTILESHFDYLVLNSLNTLNAAPGKVIKILAVNGYDPNRLMIVLATLCRHSQLPLARATLDYIGDHLEAIELRNFQELPGRGLKATVEFLRVCLGNSSLMAEFDIDLRSTGSIINPYFDQGYTVMYAAIGEEIKGLVIIKNQPALELKEVIGELKKSSIKTILLTGDNEPTASWYTSEFDLAGYIPLASPIEKSQALGKLKELENSIGIVDVSESRLMLTQIKESQSQPVFLTNLDQIPKLIKLGQVYTRQSKKIIFDSLLYHGLTIPLATGVLLSLGIMPAPAVAALISTGFVLILQQRKI